MTSRNWKWTSFCTRSSSVIFCSWRFATTAIWNWTSSCLLFPSLKFICSSKVKLWKSTHVLRNETLSLVQKLLIQEVCWWSAWRRPLDPCPLRWSSWSRCTAHPWYQGVATHLLCPSISKLLPLLFFRTFIGLAHLGQPIKNMLSTSLQCSLSLPSDRPEPPRLHYQL